MRWWLPQDGKRPCRSLEATPDLRASTSRLLTIADPVSKLSYLIDTGAEISVLPPSSGDRRNASGGLQLQAANGSSIRTFGERSVQLDLGLAKSFTWKFTIGAQPTHPPPYPNIFVLETHQWHGQNTQITTFNNVQT